ncbi:MAG TPA: hypothetical protein VKH34_01760 [Vicinamibacterales bacterium]|nr:hypothetical protein [Vicinamibacterales bacterium]
MKPLVLGTHLYPAHGAAATRLRHALDSWTRLPGVRLINLQFAGDPAPSTHAAFETLAVLREDSRTLSGCDGPRKPSVREMLDHLVAAAAASGGQYAGFSNADIVISPAAIARVAAGTRDAVIFSRMDVDPETGDPHGESLGGQDTLFIRTAAYRSLRPRLRPYIIGEAPWDVAYTSILLSHCDADLVNRGDECRHVAHDMIWRDSPFAGYSHRLARRDWVYFARWYRYYNAAKSMRAAGRPAAEEAAARDAVFGELTLRERGEHLYRQLRHGLLPPRTGDRPLVQ